MTEASPVTAPTWGTDIVPVEIGGVSYRMYADRPRNTAEILAYARRWADRPHVVQGDRVLTFADLTRAAAAKVNELRRKGIVPGDRVMILGFNSPDWVVNFWATLLARAVPVLANAWWSNEELTDAVALMIPALVLADTKAAARLPADCPTATWSTTPADTAPAEQVAVGGATSDENDPAVVIFTSGTSGRPKAVVLSHRSLLGGLHTLLHITKRLPHQVTEKDGSAGLHTGPLFHMGGIQTLLRAVVLGDTLVMPRGKFDPGEALALIESWKVTRWSAVPTMVSRVLEHPDIHVRDLRSLRSITVGGAPVTADFLAGLHAGVPGVEPRVATGWGLTENGGQATAASGRDTTERPGSCGRPLPCVELRVAPTDGEILVRSPTQMLGYFGEGSSPIDAEGWLHTGDLGHIDDDGYLWITGRSKDMIIRGGENIAPAAVEEALNGLPGVVESAVFGVPHSDLGEEVMAVVYALGDETGESLRGQLAGKLASFAIPSRWQIQGSPLPTGHSGKIDKPVIAAAARAALLADTEPPALITGSGT